MVKPMMSVDASDMLSKIGRFSTVSRNDRSGPALSSDERA